jgi:hypothetical protein
MIDHTGVEGLNLNGDVEILIEISDAGGTEVASGDWEIRLARASGPSGGQADFWIVDYSLPRPVFILGWDEQEIVLSPASADSVIAVAAHTTRVNWTSIDGMTYSYGQTLNQIANFSSDGPLRDGSQKPDISAPGTAIGSSHSSTSEPNPTNLVLPDGVHKILQGTSMSSPHVTGAVALLLTKWPWLSATQAKTALIQSARSDAMTGTVPNIRWGYGRLDLEQAFRDRLPFSLGADPPQVTAPGSRANLSVLCVATGIASWDSRYAVRVRDSRGWLELEDLGPPSPVPEYAGLTPLAGAGEMTCAPVSGLLSILVPPTAVAGDSTIVTFEASPDGLSWLGQSITTSVTVGAGSAVTPPERPLPGRLELQVVTFGLHGPSAVELAAPRSGTVEIDLFDVSGRRLGVYWRGRVQEGYRTIRRGESFPWPARGIYFLQARLGEQSAVQRVVLAK